jgi:hypothetical protein
MRLSQRDHVRVDCVAMRTEVSAMKLKNTVILKTSSQSNEEPSHPLPFLAAGGLGVVYVVNCTPVPISGISVNGIALSSLPGGSNPGQAPQSVSVERYGSPPVFGPSNSFSVTFVDDTSYSQSIQISQPAPASLTLWCFYNGFVLTGPYGSLDQLSWGF